MQQLIRRHLGVSISPCGGVAGHRSLHINYGKYSARGGDGPRSIATTSLGLTKQRLVERPRPRRGPHTHTPESAGRASAGSAAQSHKADVIIAPSIGPQWSFLPALSRGPGSIRSSGGVVVWLSSFIL